MSNEITFKVIRINHESIFVKKSTEELIFQVNRIERKFEFPVFAAEI